MSHSFLPEQLRTFLIPWCSFNFNATLFVEMILSMPQMANFLAMRYFLSSQGIKYDSVTLQSYLPLRRGGLDCCVMFNPLEVGLENRPLSLSVDMMYVSLQVVINHQLWSLAVAAEFRHFRNLQSQSHHKILWCADAHCTKEVHISCSCSVHCHMWQPDASV